MFNFFRKTRKKLADENLPRNKADQFVKYSRYAIGEIILVMVGILLALQVNNWNEERKETKLMNNLLIELSESISRDTIDLNWEIANFKRIQKHSKLIRNLINENGTYYPGLDSSFAIINTFVIQEADYVIFDRIESVGIESFKNEELKRAIKGYYDLSKLVAQVENGEIGNLFMTKIYPKYFKSFAYGVAAKPKDFEQLKTESEFIILLDYIINDSRWYLGRAAIRKKEAIELLKMIPKEINQ